MVCVIVTVEVTMIIVAVVELVWSVPVDELAVVTVKGGVTGEVVMIGVVVVGVIAGDVVGRGGKAVMVGVAPGDLVGAGVGAVVTIGIVNTGSAVLIVLVVMVLVVLVLVVALVLVLLLVLVVCLAVDDDSEAVVR